MTTRSLVKVSRRWHEPLVRVDVTDLELGVIMSLDDFALAFAAEVGVRPEMVQSAFERIVAGLRQESRGAMR